MLKKASELDKSEKLLLLQAVASGEVDQETLTPETLVAINYQDAFLGLMVAANNEGTNVICLGAAAQAKRDQIENIIITDDSDNEVLRMKSDK